MSGGYAEDKGRKRRMVVIGISSFLLVAMVVAVTVGVSFDGDESTASSKIGSDGTQQISSSMKSIKAMCESTDYPKTCVNSIHKEAGNTTDPKQLVKLAFHVAIKHIKEAANKSVTLRELEKDPRAAAALKDCKELMNDSIDELKRSFDKLGEFDITKFDNMLFDLKIWLSASITYQETCLEGFQDVKSNAGEKMKEALKTAMELSSNGLAIITELASAIGYVQTSKRRLLSEDLPVLGHGELAVSWYNPGVRRLLAAKQIKKLKPNVIVAKDGSGKYKTINKALKDIPKNNNKTFIIYIKEGVYKENVLIEKKMTHLYLLGDGAEKTKIVGNLNYIDGVSTFKTATVAVTGDYFMAKNIAIVNKAGPLKHQAVALRVSADYVTIYNCTLDGYQDTLYAHTKRQFYRDCTILGTIDFIFGDAASVFQNCKLLVRKPLDNQQCLVTAHGRKEKRQPTAIVFQNCTITADPSYAPFKSQYKAFLGRPWRNYSRTIIMESYIDDIIAPEGWAPWDTVGTIPLHLLFYTEFNNRGPGASTARRVTWKGIRKITAKHALDFAPRRFISGDRWVPQTGVPYSPTFVVLNETLALTAAPKAPSKARD